MTEFHHSIIGLPESGKTTFLAALWHIIAAGEVPTSLKLDTQIGDHKYLNAIVDNWYKCIKVPRTSVQDEKSLSINMHHPATNKRVVLGFPDLSGESFDLQVASRECLTEYVESYEHEGGILLFINANRGQDGIKIQDLGPELNDAADDNQTSDIVKWSPKFVPQQVRLVELLQFLQKRPFVRRQRRLVVAISAWDVIHEQQPEPEDWLKREYPFLHQYLIANPDSFDFRVYGISAQGGDIPMNGKAPTEAQLATQKELLSKLASERIKCVGPETQPHDLTAPICWLTRVDEQ